MARLALISRTGQPPSRRVQLASVAVIAALTIGVFWPTVHNEFLPLGFDDSLITDTEAIRGLDWAHVRAMATEFTPAHYVPLTLLSLALDYHWWGLDPRGYHLTNVLLHALTAVLVYSFLSPLFRSAAAPLMAALIFALHPLQMEAVSVAIQRKTVLSGALFFLTLIGYRRWCESQQRRWYVAALVAFAAAALAKPSVVTLPFVLVLYDYAFVDGRVRLADKLPFIALSVPITLAAVAAHARIDALHPPHGGTWLAHLLMMSRVTLEYVTAMVLPLNLSPIYYYPREMAYAPLNFVALAVIVCTCGAAVWHRRRYPWVFFGLAWFIVVLAPESNLVPLAQLRADRFLYLPVLSVAIAAAVLVERVSARVFVMGSYGMMGSYVLIGVLAILTYTSAGVWHDDVSAWRRVVERHPWCGTAAHMLGVAYADAEQPTQAFAAWTEAVRLKPDLAEPHLYLARWYAARGENEVAGLEVDRYLALAPGNPDGLALREQLRQRIGP